MRLRKIKSGDIVRLCEPHDSYYNDDFIGRILKVLYVSDGMVVTAYGPWPINACKLANTEE